MFEFARQGLERARLSSIKPIDLSRGLRAAVHAAKNSRIRNATSDLFFVLLVSFMTWSSGAVITASVLDHRL